MIPVPPLNTDNEPKDFDENCKQPGCAWLTAHPDGDPHEKSMWWSKFQPMLAKHFRYRCGWLATNIILEGELDHWLSCGPRKDDQGRAIISPHRHLAFEWENFRYATGTINSLKGTLDDRVLDPCEIEDGWFEVILPSFELVATDKIPTGLRSKAEVTLEKLQLRRHKARLTRWRWYESHWNNGNPDINGLGQDAPLVAAAVAKAIEKGELLPNPNICEPQYEFALRQRKYAPRKRV